MKIDAGEAAALAAVLQRDLEVIAGIEAHALRLPESRLSREQLDSLGFALHNLYNTLENSFAQVSLSFENHVKDPARWHRELLEKMLLDVPPLRPRVSLDSDPMICDTTFLSHLQHEQEEDRPAAASAFLAAHRRQPFHQPGSRL